MYVCAQDFSKEMENKGERGRKKEKTKKKRKTGGKGKGSKEEGLSRA